MKKKRKRFLLILIALSIFLFVVFQVFLRNYDDENREIRTFLRETVKSKYPDSVRKMAARYGIKPADGYRECNRDSSVILVHGLDDPGKVWMNLAPVLFDKGFCVWQFLYPNDQPIEESARLFYHEMELFRKNRAGVVSVVAHSMGGLVAREMLTNPELDYQRKVKSNLVPEVPLLLMIATPNHGSELSRYRIFMELRDQVARLFSGEYIWMQSILDGAGEAGLDLVPESRFLKNLNSRPHPDNVSMVLIAGMMQGENSSEIDDLIRGIKVRLPENNHDYVTKIGEFMKSVSQGMGDGLVAVESVKMDGIPLHIVAGTHLSIIRNIQEESSRMPPAIPIVLDYLDRD